MEIKALSVFDGNIQIKNEIKRVLPWQKEDILQLVYDDEKQTIVINNLSLQSILKNKETVNFTTFKMYKIIDFWEQVTGNYEKMNIELEKLLRPILITEHVNDILEEIKKNAIEDLPKMKNMSLALFIKKKGFHKKYLRR